MEKTASFVSPETPDEPALLTRPGEDWRYLAGLVVVFTALGISLGVAAGSLALGPPRAPADPRTQRALTKAALVTLGVLGTTAIALDTAGVVTAITAPKDALVVSATVVGPLAVAVPVALLVGAWGLLPMRGKSGRVNM
jgi:hypothetical protein